METALIGIAETVQSDVLAGPGCRVVVERLDDRLIPRYTPPIGLVDLREVARGRHTIFHGFPHIFQDVFRNVPQVQV